MKKRKVKDFIALYAPEDEEKLVLIQSGTSADKTFLDTFWTAHTHCGGAGQKTGGAAGGPQHLTPGRCRTDWLLTFGKRNRRS